MKNNFFFVSGASGSGSTIFAQVLTNLHGSLGVGDAHTTLHNPIAEKFAEASNLAWERESDFNSHDFHMARLKKMLTIIETSKEAENMERIVFKRSTISGDSIRPDLRDIQDVFPQAKAIVSFRSPSSAAHSAFSRLLGKSLRHCALQQEEQLTLLSSWASDWPDDALLAIEYEDFCLRPHEYAALLSDFCKAKKEDVTKAIKAYPVDKSEMFGWAKSEKPEIIARLNDFFSPRHGQWLKLAEKARTTRDAI